ncbi:MAG: response regulator transcription factor [Pseudonocardiales bacterium]|nr:response regulator transcription factor [Pseudonocardiales bacterium]MBV9028924.1 response regulator transcription factor [Pseudonocardiales bacterium]MBW0008496.1 response regulator transcription factor [Pseudonocardiales bacterium]
MSGNDDNPGLVVLAVDDEPHCLSMLVDVLNAEPRIGTVLTAANGEEAMEMLRPANGTPPPEVDVAFLDMKMPGLDGLELANLLAKLPHPPAVVFATAYDEQALDAFELGVADYVMKPVSRERVASTLRRIVAARRDPATAGPEQGGEDEVIPVELAGTTKLVLRSSVRWVEAHGDYARLHTGEATSHLVRIPLSQLEDRWSDAGFVRIHRSYLVALPLVTELRMSSSGYMVRVGSGDDATELPVSRRHTRDLKDRLVRAAKQGWTSR